MASLLCPLCGKNPPSSDNYLCYSCECEYPWCYECGEKKRVIPHKLCTDCYAKASGGGGGGGGVAISSGVLSRLDPKKAEYKRAHKQFTSTWVKYHPVPEPAAIYAVSNHSVWEAFQKYIKRLRANDSDATTDYYFHGTTLQCDILSTDSCCSDVNCGICGIVTRGFDKRLIGKNIPRFKRYGDAFYLAPNSSKCHDYTQGIESVGMRAQLLCVVACGTKFETKRDHTHFKTAPQYSDSVYGQSGGTLNYEEVAVYESQAILPEFVIVYNKNGVHKIAV